MTWEPMGEPLKSDIQICPENHKASVMWRGDGKCPLCEAEDDLAQACRDIEDQFKRAEKAEERIKDLEGFLDWTEEDEEWDKTWQQIMKEWKEGVYDE